MRRALILGLGAVLGAVGVIILLGWLARTGVISPSSGSDAFKAGRYEMLIEAIEDGGPLLFPDPLGGNRQRILQHIGSDPGVGWFAFDARRPEAPDECLLQWQPEAEVFTDSCDGTIVEADGDGLPQYEVTINEGVLEIIFATPLPQTTTTTAPRS